ncbi:gluconate 5-dehydrogenase [Prosthecobacter debontii]|uniref:Gluconate 5-dehydrogenase n=1 Tax=Prosthecobacter debontii TaxID=48467 RepID=A0A1T4YR18_9BACT|nr:SDR family oxidoreductase [Prosthecobacter debontii]SKB04294.1 gluconate 5-dehydrogenase [Prosthecobacter debontii]
MTHSLFDLSGKKALVTGGSKGLGKAMARGFAEAGADVMISSRSENELTAAAAEIQEGLSIKVEWMVADMTDRAQVKALASEAEQRLGKVDILINNAGANHPQAIDEITDEVWDRMVELDLTSCMALTRYLVPGMKERKWGRVIHISSVLGVGSKEKRNAYSACKAALIGLAKASAIDLGPFNITVNCLCPGPFLTDLPMSLLSESEKQAFANRTALQRWGLPRELAGPALMLASEAGSYITGEALLVDGGAFARAL